MSCISPRYINSSLTLRGLGIEVEWRSLRYGGDDNGCGERRDFGEACFGSDGVLLIEGKERAGIL
jgi:hypothetical protein